MPSLFGAVVTGSVGVVGALLVSKHRKQLNLKAKSQSEFQDHQGQEHNKLRPQKWDYNWDRMAPVPVENEAEGKSEVAKSKASRILILIRHGQYVWDPHDPEKRILTELGRKQAAITGQRLKEVGYSYDTLYYSTMPRATETAQIIMQSLPGVPTHSCDLMREGAPIRPEPMHKTWKPESHEFFRDGPRIEAAFRKYFHRAPPSQTEDSIEILVCHANVIRYFVCRALQLPPEAWLRISLANASITKVTCRPSGTVSLKTLGSCEHMPKDVITY